MIDELGKETVEGFDEDLDFPPDEDEKDIDELAIEEEDEEDDKEDDDKSDESEDDSDDDEDDDDDEDEDEIVDNPEVEG